MKKLFAFALMTLSFSTFAYDLEPHYYATEFKVVSVKPMCPRSIPNGAVCMGLGSIVTVEASLNGCLDELLFSDFDHRISRGAIELYAVGVAKMDPKSLAAYCTGMPKVRKTITISSPGAIKLINQRIEQ